MLHDKRIPLTGLGIRQKTLSRYAACFISASGKWAVASSYKESRKLAKRWGSYATAVASISTSSSGKAKLATPNSVEEGRHPDSARRLATTSNASRKRSTSVV